MFKVIAKWITVHPLKAIIAVVLITGIIEENIPKSDEQIAKEEQKRIERQQKEDLQEQQRQEAEAALQKQDDEETSDFIKSKERTKVYSSTANADTIHWATIRAKSGIKRVANDPNSITDVTPATELVRMRIKDFPNARFAMNVTYRGKNKYGALVMEKATILFDREYNVINVLPTMVF